MIVSLVRFRSELADREVQAMFEERSDSYRNLRGLVEKLYLRLRDTGEFGAVYVWESEEDLIRFRQSSIARTIPSVYQVEEAPTVEIADVRLLSSSRPRPRSPSSGSAAASSRGRPRRPRANGLARHQALSGCMGSGAIRVRCRSSDRGLRCRRRAAQSRDAASRLPVVIAILWPPRQSLRPAHVP